jgi:hypothetical protein
MDDDWVDPTQDVSQQLTLFRRYLVLTWMDAQDRLVKRKDREDGWLDERYEKVVFFLSECYSELNGMQTRGLLEEWTLQKIKYGLVSVMEAEVASITTNVPATFGTPTFLKELEKKHDRGGLSVLVLTNSLLRCTMNCIVKVNTA